MPASSAEVDLWSAVHLRCLTAASRVASKILGLGGDHSYLLRDGPWIVALRRTRVPEIGLTLNRGAWVNLSTGMYGENLVELYAQVHGCSYRNAIFVLANEAKIVSTDGDPNSEDAIRNWVQEVTPLRLDFAATYRPPNYPWDSEFCLYYNSSRHVILQAIRWKGGDGSTIRVYRSLWCHHRGYDSLWAEILPQTPLPLFNLDLVQSHPNLPVVLVKDEFLATELGKFNFHVLFSTIPGGLKNLLSADLEPLRGRTVRVVMERDDLAIGLQAEHALRKAGVENACFSLDIKETPRSFEYLEHIAAQKGVVLLPTRAENILALPSQIVVEAGEPIPGGDQVRPTIIYPIIRPGDLVWLLAEPKIGKTRIMLALACGAERGNCEVGRWRIIDPVGVLYVDGEMQPDDLRRAIAMVMAGAGDEPGPAPFAIICAKSQPDGVVDITSPEWQTTIEKALRNKKLLILDNFQSLTDNGPAALNQVRPWLRHLIRLGIAVIVVDHTNRDGDLQGSIAKERIADLLIALRYPDDHAKKEGRVFVEYPRARHLNGEDEEPYELRKVFTDTTFKLEVVEPKPSCHIDVRPQIFKIALVVFARDQEHLSYPEMSKKYDIPQSTAHGYYQEARTLTGDEKAAFETELQRLTFERGLSS